MYTLNGCGLLHANNNSIELFFKKYLQEPSIDLISQSMMMVNCGRATATLMQAEVANFTELRREVLCIMAFLFRYLLQRSLQLLKGRKVYLSK